MIDARREEVPPDRLNGGADPAAVPWHALPAQDALDRLGSRRDGLRADEAEQRLARDGPNLLTARGGRSALARFAAQFTNVLVLVLVASAGAMVLIGEHLDAAVVTGIVLLNAIIGFVQEGRAERALEEVRKSLAPVATVVREGLATTIPAERVVRGDVLALSAGDVVPADVRLIEEQGLEAQQAALTGESDQVPKSVAPVSAETPLAQRSDMLWAGTVIARGIGRGVVVEIGDGTEIGRIGRLVAEGGPRDTPLSRQLARFGRRLTATILAVAVAFFVVGVGLEGRDAIETFRAAVALAIAAVPEALPAILTVAMAVGVTRMAKRQVIVRRLAAVEALGSVDVIWTDKTGTITRNELTVREAATTDGRFEVTGIGYAPDGRVLGIDHAPAGDDPLLRELARGALLANDGDLRAEGTDWEVEGDLTDGALLAFAAKAGLHAAAARAASPRVAEIPYEADRQYMATLNRHAGGLAVWLKGGPERVFDLCAGMAVSGTVAGGVRPLDRRHWDLVAQDLAARGLRLIAVARRPAAGETLTPHDVERGGFVLLGLVGLTDPPRPEARESIASAHAAGIEVKLITGDHPETAKAIAAQVGLHGRTLTGPEFDRLTGEAFDAAVRDTVIVARATPEHKRRLIDSLQRQGRSCAMTGDGFNDAPALIGADIGVAMGGRGTAAAREASDIVLADDNFASIVAAVREGRGVYANIRKAVIYVLPTSVDESALIILAVLFGQALPITALQILWINLVTEATLSLSIAFDRPEPNVMDRPPRHKGAPLLSLFLLWRIGFVAGLMTAVGWTLFQMLEPFSVDVARTVVVNALVGFEIAYLFNCRRLHGSSLKLGVLIENRILLASVGAVIGFQLLFTYSPWMNRLFDSAPLTIEHWLLVAGPALGLFLIVEAEKAVTRRLRKLAD